MTVCGTHDNYVSRYIGSQCFAMVQVLIDNVTYYLLQYIICYYGSLSAHAWRKSKCLLLVGIRTASRCALWRNVLRLFRQFCGALVPKSPLLIYANQMLPVPTTLSPEMRQADLEQLTAWPCAGEESLFAAVYFPFEFKYCMHTNYCGMYIVQMPSEWGFSRLYSCETYFVLKLCDLWGLPLWQSHSSGRSTTAFTEWSVSLLSFGETLLTLPRVVDTSTIYLCWYAVGAFVAILCTNKSGRFQ